MQFNITSPRFTEDELAQRFINEIEAQQNELSFEDAILYYEFPMYRSIDERPDYTSFMIISPQHGIIMIQCDDRSFRSLNETEIEKLYNDLSQMYSTVFANLIKIPALRRNRNQLKFDIYTLLYLPNYEREFENGEEEEIYVATRFADLTNYLKDKTNESIDSGIINEITSIIEGTKAIPKPKNRNIPEESKNKKGGLLEQLEKEIATFDRKQKMAALTIIDGPQRIRGLAGSGKTIVLAMKAALLHLRNPEAKILYTFYTKSLYDHIKRLITRFYRMYEDYDPNWDNINIRHAWGGQTIQGVYYDTCRSNGVTPISFGEAKQFSVDPFDYVCRDLLDKTGGNLKKVYDYVLLDEGQDFEPSFYWICRKIVKNDRIVWAYDELQNIMDVEMQETMKLFANPYGDEGIDLAALQERYPRQSNDIVLHKCYRNPREILLLAHAIGFGIYNDVVLQKLENTDHWEDIGYEMLKGNCKEGEHTVITRPRENSPLSISDQLKPDEIIYTYAGKSMVDEIEWVCNAIENDIKNQNLLPEDILVICIDNKFARKYFSAISENLRRKEIFSNNLFDSYLGDDFIVEGSVTLSTVYKAKGNEAAAVYLVGADTFFLKKNDIVERNKLFTAFTRAKAWLTVTGANDENTEMIFKEMREAISKFPNLDFIYPGNVKTLRRELAEASEKENKVLKGMQELFDKMGLSAEEAIELWSKQHGLKK